MKVKDFEKTINTLSKPEKQWHQTLQSLWWDKKGNWDRAHSIAQDIPSLEGSAIHAYLHREEGVLWNADYWYNRAGRERPDVPLDKEWAALVLEMLEKFSPHKQP